MKPILSGRTEIDFNTDWKFHLLPTGSAISSEAVETSAYNDCDWESVTLPHTYNARDGASGRTGICEGGEHYYRGPACYRKHFFFVPQDQEKRRYYLEFSGVNTTTELYVNDRLAGRHEGGYARFRFDITDLLLPNKQNLFCVKVSNAPSSHIAPITDQGDFTKMGGIYREVTLISVPLLHLDLLDFGSSGVYITPQQVSQEEASFSVLAKLRNDAAKPLMAAVTVQILDDRGICVLSAINRLSIGANESTQTSFSFRLANPHLWDGRKNPALYRAVVSLQADELHAGEPQTDGMPANGLQTDGSLADMVTQTFGFRNILIDSQNGFFLNGSHLSLHGVNYHQDSYENGWAMTNAQRTRDYQMMYDLGCTSVRMAHYQHHPFEYDLCDRLGITVWTEIGIINKMSADPTDALSLADGFAENARQQLTELIRQNYNHPSVIVWGLSNELFQMSDDIYALYETLHTLARSEDSSRPTVFADSQFYGRFLTLPAEAVGYNRYFGWYQDAGPAEAFGEWLDLYHEQKETRPVCLSEYGGGGAISQHKDLVRWPEEIDPWGERHYENYQSALHEKIWSQLSVRTYLWGTYIWCMFDFASDGREEGDTKGQNDKGLATRERIPKDAFYFYQSVWNETPMLHLTEKRFKQRPCLIPCIKAYSNAESVTLYVNQILIGDGIRNEDTPTVFYWEQISLIPGQKNSVSVTARFRGGKTLTDSANWWACLLPDHDLLIRS